MEETIAEISPSLIQLESETAQEVVRQVVIYKYVELGVTVFLATLLLFGMYKIVNRSF